MDPFAKSEWLSLYLWYTSKPITMTQHTLNTLPNARTIHETQSTEVVLFSREIPFDNRFKKFISFHVTELGGRYTVQKTVRTYDRADIGPGVKTPATVTDPITDGVHDVATAYQFARDEAILDFEETGVAVATVVKPGSDGPRMKNEPVQPDPENPTGETTATDAPDAVDAVNNSTTNAPTDQPDATDAPDNANATRTPQAPAYPVEYTAGSTAINPTWRRTFAQAETMRGQLEQIANGDADAALFYGGQTDDPNGFWFGYDYKILTGDKTKFFTLWRVIHGDFGKHHTLASREFVKNLSNDWATAVDEAGRIIVDDTANGDGRLVFVQLTTGAENTKGWDEDLYEFPFGKYQGAKFANVTDGSYKIWLYGVLSQKTEPRHQTRAQNLYAQAINSGEFVEYDGELISDKFYNRIQSGDIVRADGRFYSREKYDEIMAKRDMVANSDWIEADFFEGYAWKKWERSFDTPYGTKFVTGFIDANGDCLVSKGQPFFGPDGMRVYIRAKIKDHDRYNGMRQNVISHVKGINPHNLKDTVADIRSTGLDPVDYFKLPDFPNDEARKHVYAAGNIPKAMQKRIERDGILEDLMREAVNARETANE